MNVKAMNMKSFQDDASDREIEDHQKE